MTQAAPSATLNNIVTAAVATYGSTPALGGQWTQVSMTSILQLSPALAGEMAAVGFSGQVSVNTQTGEVIIADRGTANGQNVVTDVQVATLAATNAKSVADAFALAGLTAAQRVLSQSGVTLSAVYTTGHSLGGAESQEQAAMLSVAMSPEGTPVLPTGVTLTNVSIDAPGIAGIVGTGNSHNYNSYNFSSQGDVVHLAGGPDLAGTTNISLPVGPSMWATAGLLGLGGVASLAVPGVGAMSGATLIGLGLSQAADAHSSALMLNSLIATALGNMPMSQLSGLSSTQMLNLFGVSQQAFDAMTPTQQVALIGQTPSTSSAPVYDSAGYDQNGYNQNGYNIYGVDKNGNLDSAIAANGGETNADTLSDGTKITVVIAADGSAVATTDATDGTVSTVSRNAAGQVIGINEQAPDGSTLTETIDPTTGALTGDTVTTSDGTKTTYTYSSDGSVTITTLNAANQETDNVLFDAGGQTTQDQQFSPTTGVEIDAINYTGGVETDEVTYTNGIESSDEQFNAADQETGNVVFNASGQTVQDQQFNPTTGVEADAINYSGGVKTDEATYTNGIESSDEQFNSAGQETNNLLFNSADQETQDQQYSTTTGKELDAIDYSGGVKTDEATYGSNGLETGDVAYNAAGKEIGYDVFNAAGQKTDDIVLNTAGTEIQDQQFNPTTDAEVDAINYTNSVKTDEAIYSGGVEIADQVYTSTGADNYYLEFTYTDGVKTSAAGYFPSPGGMHGDTDFYNAAGQITGAEEFSATGQEEWYDYYNAAGVIYGTEIYNPAGQETEYWVSNLATGGTEQEQIFNPATGQMIEAFNYGANDGVTDESFYINGVETADKKVNSLGQETDYLIINPAGQVTQDQQFVASTGVKTDAIDYSNGIKTDEIIYNANGLDDEELVYNTAGQLIGIGVYNTAGQETAFEVLNSTGQITQLQQFNATTGVKIDAINYTNGVKTDEVTYNSSGQEIQDVTYNSAGTQTGYENFTTSGQVITGSVYNATSKLTDIITYNTAGQMIQDQQFNPTTGIKISAVNYSNGVKTDIATYNSAGQEIQDTSFNSGGVETGYEVFSQLDNQTEGDVYNPAGQLLEAETFNAAGQKTQDALYNPATGLKTSVINYANGIKTDQESFNAAGQETQDAKFNTTGQQTGTELYNSAGQETDFDTFDPNSGLLTQDAQFNPSTGLLVDSRSYADLAADDYQTSLSNYNAAGQISSQELFNSIGQLTEGITNLAAGGSQVALDQGIPAGFTSWTENFSGADGLGLLQSTVGFEPDGNYLDVAYSYNVSNVETSYLDSLYSSANVELSYADYSADGAYVSGSTDAGGGGTAPGGGTLGPGGDGGGTYGGDGGGDGGDGGGYGFAGTPGTIKTAVGSNIGSIAAYDLSHGNLVGARAAEAALQQAQSSAAATPTTGTGPAVLTGDKWAGDVITWSLASVSDSGSSPFSASLGSAYDAEVEQAFATWAAASGLTLKEVSGSATADINIGWADLNTPSTGVLGYTSTQASNGLYSSGTTIQLEDPAQDALLSSGNNQQTYAGTDATLSQVLLHEIGHALGLADDSDQDSVMYYDLTGSNQTLDATDIAAIQTLYGGAGNDTQANFADTTSLTAGAQQQNLKQTQVGAQLDRLVAGMASFNPEAAGNTSLNYVTNVEHHAVIGAAIH